MTTLQFLHHLRELGIQLWAEDDRLRFTAPQGALTAELRNGLSGRKQEILRLLRQAPAAGRSAGPVPMPGEVAASGRVPLSFSQQRLWFLQQLDPASAAYNISRAMLLSGPLRVDLLERSLAEVVRRHAVLRTTFATAGGEPFQVIAPAAGWRLPLVDLRSLPEAVRWAEMQRLSVLLADEPMDLARGPLLRIVLLHLGAEEHVAAATMHHIISDAWSTGLLFREMGVVYGAFAQGLPSPLPELPIQYADYSWWQRQHLEGEVLEQQLDYWKEQLAGAPEVLELPTDRPRSAARSDRGGRVGALIPRELVEPLKALGQAEGAATLFMVLLAGFDALLYRGSGQEDMVVGFPIANRNRTEVEGLIGLFINTLVLRTRLAAELSWRDLLGQVRQTTLDAYAHQDLPFEKLVEELRPERQLSQTPIFQVTFSLQNAPGAEMQVGSFRMSLLPAEAKTAQFDLTCDMKETAEGIDVSWRYREDLFDRPTVVRLTGHYLNLLADVAAHPDRPLADLVLLSTAERHQLLAEWSEVPAPAPPRLPLHALFEEQATLRPGEPAVVWDGGRLSYGELDRRADRLARHLRAFGVDAEVPVAFCLERSPEAVVTILAILKAGGAYVPLDPAAPMERLGWMLDDVGAPVVITTENLADRLPRTMAILVVLEELAELEDGGEDVDPEPSAGGDGGDALAYVMYTSGSTGNPKGVAVVHRAVARLVRSGGFAAFGPGEAWAQLAPLSFDASTLEIWGALLHGGRLVLLPELPDPVGLGEALARHQVTSLWLTAGLFHQIVEENPAGLAPLSQLLAGGDVLSPGHVRRALAAHPGLRLINGYGPTENTTFTCCGPLREAGEVGWTVPLGRPIGRTRIHVLDAALRPVPIGVEGELYTGGDGLARGYHGRPELTAERFVPDPWSGGSGAPGDRLYRTGDRARHLADGRLEFLGRLDRQVKVRGFRIEPQEIEAALAQHSGLREAVVEALPDPTGGRRLVAYVVPRGEAPEVSALRSFLAGTLPPYMLPAAFVTLPELPLTPNGKVDRRALPDPSLMGAAEERELAAPADPVEEIIAGVWAEVLGLSAVGIDQDFFEIGGHSLLATQVISRMTEALQVMIPLPRFFEEPTVREQAELIRAARRQAEPGQEIPAIVPVPRDRVLPLSFAQQRLWFIDQLEPGSAAYNIPAAVRLAGRLDPPAMERALQEVVRRHEALRTVFASRQGEPFQRIVPELRPSLPVADLAGLPAERRRDETERLAGGEAERPFDLAAGPLVRWNLLRLGPEEHLALVTMHHIVSDGWSAGIFLRELAALYEACSRGEPSPFTDLPVQYADFAVWQRGWLAGEALERQIGYWRRQLAGVPARLELPTDRPRPSVQAFRGATLPVALPRALAGDLAVLGRRMGATAFMMLLAGFQALLSRLSGQDDVLVGSPIAGRNRREIEGLIGFFVNTLVLRGDLTGEPGFRQFVTRVRATALAAYEHQDLPFERLVEELAPERSLAHSPLFQVAFALQNAPGGAFELPGLTLTSLPTGGGVAKWDLTFTLGEGAGGDNGLTGSIAYSTDLFDRTTVMRLVEQLRTLLEDVVMHPDKGLPDLVLLPAAGRQQLLVEWSAEPTPELPDLPIHAFFEEQATRRPEAPAVVWDGGWMSYSELDRRARGLAHHLRGLGVGPEVRVAFFLERSPEMVVTTLAILQAGGAYVPLDPGAPAERLSWMLDDVGAPVLVTARHLLGRLPGTTATVVILEDLPADGSEERLPRRTGGHSLAYVMYTSGSTGRPKGVAVAHRGVVRLVRGGFARFGPEQSWSQIAPVSFDAATLEIWGALLHGGRLVLLPDLPEPRALGEAVARLGITSLWLTTALFHQMVEENLYGLAPLTQVLSGGEVMSPAHVRRVLTAHPDLRLVIAYGPTENTTFTTCDPLTGEVGRDQVGETVPLGRPIAYTGVRVLDAGLSPVPVGAAGELYVGGEGLARGYLNRPDLTAERFVPDPWGAPGARLYRTGDRARWLADGRLDFLGRVDRQVKIRGFRIEPGEVEAALARHPGLRDAVVDALPEPAGGRRLVAWAVPRDEASSPSILELRAFLSATLPAYMVPAAWVFLPELPLNANGKVDRRALPAPAGSAAAAVDGGAPAAPADPVEELLAGIWAEVLGLDRVGVHDDFFALGGHSLLATQVTSRIAAAFQVTLPLQQFFESPTVAGQARLVQEARRAEGGAPEAPPIVPVPRDTHLPLSFSQQRLWFVDQLEPGSAVYNIPAAIHLAGDLDVAALERALQGVVARHEALRTSFPAVEGQPFQRIEAESRQPLASIDLSGLPPVRRDGEAQCLAREEALRSFDLTRPPLIRWTLLRLRHDEYVALVTQHHIVSDGWSTSIFLRELAALYEAVRRGVPAPLSELPDLPVQYADFAAWQRRWLTGEALERQLSYWRRRLAGAPQRLDLPTDRPRPAVHSSRGASLAFALPVSLTAAVTALGRRSGATLFMTLLAAFEALLVRITHQEDFLLASSVAGRNRREVEGLIGFFINSLVLRAGVAGDAGFEQLLAETRATTLEAYEHQDLPFERLVEELAPERSLAHSPLFQVVFALHNVPSAVFELPGLTLSPWPPGSGGAKFDLTFALAETAAGLAGSIEYSADLFDASNMARLAEHYRVLLADVVDHPDRRVSDLALLSAPERHQALLEWSAVAAAELPDPPIHVLFEEQAARRPQAPAVVWDGGSMSYGELDRQASVLACYLCSLGVGPEVPVAFCLERSPEMVVATLAILKAGGAYVPLDPGLPMERLAWMLADTGSPVVVTTERLLGVLPQTLAIVVLLDRLEETAAESPAAPVFADSLAYVMYTSGSTGAPKGVAVVHRAVVRLVRGSGFADFGPGQTWGQLAPVSFDAATLEIWGALLNGGILALLPETPEPEVLGDALARHGVTSLWLTAGLFNTMAEQSPGSLAPLRQLLAGGDTLAPEPVRRVLAENPELTLINGYGPTENTTFTCCGPLREPGEVGWTVSLGRPIAQTRVYVLESEQWPAPIGVAGELYTGGAGLARGYHGRPDLTAERFVPDPCGREAGARLYRTGDRVRYLADGRLEFLGRLDRQVKIRGFRIEPQEVELALARYPGLQEAVVDALPDGMGGRRLIAWVVPRGEAVTAGELRSFLAETLPSYMLPAGFVVLPSLPLTSNGKVDRRALPPPDGSLRAVAAVYVEPATPTERELAAIWAEVLGHERVGAGDDFFELGGHSLLAVRVVAQMRAVFRLDLSLRLLFDRPKLADLAAAIEQEQLEHAVQGDLEELLAEMDLLSEEEAELELSAAGDTVVENEDGG